MSSATDMTMKSGEAADAATGTSARSGLAPRSRSRAASAGGRPTDRVGTTVSHVIRVTESRTADYVNGDSYVVPVGAMVNVDALEEEIATSRTYSPAALAADVEHVAQAALASHLAWNETSVPVETALRFDAPALIDSHVTLALTFAAVADDEIAFDFAVSDRTGRAVGSGRHVRRVCDSRAMQRDLAALREAAAAAE